MRNRKLVYWFVSLLLILPLALAACTSGDVEQAIEEGAAAIEQAAEQVQDNAGEIAEQVEAAADEAVEAAQEAVDEAAAVVEETTAEEEPAMEEEAMEEEPAAEEPAAEEEMMEEDMACAPATEGPLAGIDIRGVEFEWWHNHRGSREEALLPLLDRFNAENECGVTIVPLNQGSYGDIRDKVNGNIASGGTLPSLVVGYQNDQAFYQLNDALVDMDTYMNDPYWGLAEDEKADFYASFVEQGVHAAFGNERLGFPPNRSMEMLFWNQTWLEELGYTDGPTTPDEFVEMACAGAAANGDGTGGYILRDDASGLAAWTLAFGGDVVDADGNYNYNNDATIAAMTMLKQMYDDGCAYFFTEGFPNPEVAARRALFAQGSSSGIPFYLGDFATIAEEDGRDPDELGIGAIPHTTADPVQNIYGGDVMIVASSPEQQLAAWYFLKWFTSPEIQAEWVDISNYFPTRRATFDYLGDFEADNEAWATAADLLEFGQAEPQLISYDQVRRAAQEAFNEMMQGAEIEATLEELDAFGNELQEELMAEVEQG